MNRKYIADTNRLLLRELEPADAEAFYKLNANPKVIKYTGDKPFASVSETRSFIENYKHYKLNGYGRWAVIEKTSQKFIGFCGLKKNEEGLVDLGFRLLEETWGKGYATEAAYAAIDIGFNKFDIPAIIGRADRENIASIKVLKKLGMQFWKQGTTIHINKAVYYKIEKSDFRKQKNK